jgi:hypothetical protein
MCNTIAKLMTAAVIAVAVPLYAGIASAAPVSGAFAIKNAAPSNIENVRYYGWHGGGYGWRGGWGRGYYGGGWGVGAGIAAGALIAGALAAPYYYGGGSYYASPYYYAPAPGYYAEPYDDGVAYCMQRYRSYDPRSGTFLGNDGYRHPCP